MQANDAGSPSKWLFTHNQPQVPSISDPQRPETVVSMSALSIGTIGMVELLYHSHFGEGMIDL